jgi:hypothetical protein
MEVRMRCFKYSIGVWALGLLIGVVSGCGSDGSAGPATEFVADPPVTLSGPTPFGECGVVPGREAERENSVEPWISVNPVDPENLVGAWIQGMAVGHVSSASFDGGANWEEVVIPGLSECSGDDQYGRVSDPWLAFASNGDLYAVALPGPDFGESGPTSILVSKSIDGGKTWGAPTTVSEAVGDDKPSIVADPVDPCLVYVGWTRFTLDDPQETLLSRTTDCGESWTDPQLLFANTPPGGGFQLLVLPDGTALAFFEVQIEGTLYVTRSTDKGATWDEPTLITATGVQSKPVTPDGEELIRAGHYLFDVAVDRQSGYLAAVWYDFFQGAPLISPGQVAFSSSTDGGLTWTDPVRIDRTPANDEFALEQAFTASVEISDDGTIGVTYYDFQNATTEGPPYWSDHWFTNCHPELVDCNDPASWGEAVRLTPESFDYALAPYADVTSNQGYFLGDYMGLTSAGSDFLALFSVTTEKHPADTVFVRIRGR